MSRSTRYVPLLLVAFLLCSCADSSGEEERPLVPRLIADAIEHEHREARVLEECERLYPASDFVAAISSTAGEVGRIAAIPPGEDHADLAGLPADPDTPVIICVSSGRDGDDVVYLADWIAETSTGVLTMFDEHDLRAAGRRAGSPGQAGVGRPSYAVESVHNTGEVIHICG